MLFKAIAVLKQEKTMEKPDYPTQKTQRKLRIHSLKMM